MTAQTINIEEIKKGDWIAFYNRRSEDILEVALNQDEERPNWAYNFHGYFNGEYFGFKTWKAFQKRVTQLITKYNLTRDNAKS